METSIHGIGGAALRALGLGLLLGLSACGGGGGGGDDGGNTPPPSSGDPWEDRTATSDPKAQVCADPRTGVDPYTGQSYPDVQGSIEDEKDWLALYMDEVYLWYDEIPNVSQSPYTVSTYGSVDSAMAAYFYALLTPASTASGKEKDAYSFVYPTADWQALSQGGVSVGYGLQFYIAQSSPPRELYAAYVDPGTPAAVAGIEQRARIISIDGVDVANGSDTDTLNAGLSPDTAGESHVFVYQNLGSSTQHTVTLTADEVTSTPVQQVTTVNTPTGRVGYLLFNDHIATAEGGLFDAIETLAAQDISDLVLDLRYNGGGYLDIASELAYMIAGPDRTDGSFFEDLHFNDHNPLATLDTETPFHDTTLGFDDAVADGTPLPTLDLDRVFVLSSSWTCSASEAIVNGLRGIGVEVVMIGDTTCGKPYGFFAWDNCGLSYFAIEFAGTNAVGDEVDPDGIVPSCYVEDDFDHRLGDPQEARFAAALGWRDGTAACAAAATAKRSVSLPSWVPARDPLRESAWLRHPSR